VVDLDGNEYVDFHNGYGAMAVGHAHPRIVEASPSRVRRGTHFAQPTEELGRGRRAPARALRPAAVAVRQLRHRGTLDAVRLMRAYTGRDILLKIEGAYHGHHDALMVSVAPPATRSATTRTRSRCRRPRACRPTT
jgi:glutamate-1-semialdehyde 2,1-aminomutase